MQEEKGINYGSNAFSRSKSTCRSHQVKVNCLSMLLSLVGSGVGVGVEKYASVLKIRDYKSQRTLNRSQQSFHTFANDDVTSQIAHAHSSLQKHLFFSTPPLK